MAIYTSDIPYMITQNRKVALPRSDSNINKSGFGSLVFLFSNSVTDSIKMIRNNNCYNDNKYKWYQYDNRYIGKIGSKRYNIRCMDEQKEIYKRVEHQTTLSPHPKMPLNKTQNRNCYFDLSKYFELYKFITKKYSLSKKVLSFWNFFSNIMINENTSTYPIKTVLIDADMFSDFKGAKLKDKLDNPIFMIYYTLYKYFDLRISDNLILSELDIDFVIYCKRSVLKMNFSKCNEKSHVIFNREIKKIMSKKTVINAFDAKKIDEESQKDEIKDELMKSYNFVGDNEEESSIITTLKEDPKKINDTKNKKVDVEKDIEDKLEEHIKSAQDKIKEVIPDADMSDKSTSDYIKTQSSIDVEADNELAKKMYSYVQSTKVPTKPLSTARDAAMRSRQESLKVGSTTIGDIKKIKVARRSIPEKDLSGSLNTINKNVKKMKYANMDKDYIRNIMSKDIIDVFTSLNSKHMKLYVRDIKSEETSDTLNYKETIKVVFEDEQKQRHTVSVDIPKFIEDKFLYLGGNKKIINKQNFLYPIVKTGPDTVQVVANYNKVFVRRIGSKSISAVERIMKMIGSNDKMYDYFTVGDNSVANKTFITTIEYDEFAKVVTKFKSKNCTIFFNQNEATEFADNKGISDKFDFKDMIFIGTYNNGYLFLNTNTQMIKYKGPDENKFPLTSIPDIIVNQLPDELQKQFFKTRSTKKLMYTAPTILQQEIPLVILLMFWEGFSSVVNKMKLKYRFSDKYPTLAANESVIRFKDAYFIYEEDLPISLMMNGLRMIDTENFTIEEYNTHEPYVEFLTKKYGKTGAMNALRNYYEFLIDPITMEILDDTNLPTDIIEIFIYANNLLADESYTNENSQILSRVRSSEIIAAILYYQLSGAYLEYRNSAGKKKISLPKDCVIKELMSLQTVEDYSTLNPVVEVEKSRTITSKGWRGINQERAYSEEKRSYDESMVGVMAMSTSPDGNCGINRVLTMEPSITSARGYVDVKDKDKLSELSDVNLYSPTELLFPLGNTRDDSMRIAMAGKQSKHVIPVKNASPALISNGVDEAIRFELSSDFVVNADDDGEVVEINEKTSVMMIKYKNGSHRAVDLSPNIVKNGGGGFFLNNLLITNLKEGDKFKKDQPLAWHKDFFKNDGINGLRMNVGVLEKVAITSSYDSYNDATVITHKLARDAEADMTFRKQIVVGKNANIYDMRKIGDHVSIGDPLISFDTSFEDSDLNKLLSHLSDDNKKVLDDNSTNIIKSKYAGTIIDIKIYSTVALEELSESLRKIVKSYYNRVDSKKKFVSKYDSSKSLVKCGLLLNENSGQVTPNAYGIIKGQKVQDAVLIEFYIEHGDIMGVGDKLAYFTALKGIVSEVIPEGYEPYSEFRPNEEVSSIIGPSAILKRQVPSILLTVLGNKVIVELKRKLEEIYNE